MNNRHETRKEYAGRLRRFRIASVMGKTRIAQETGIGIRQYEMYENGETVIPLDYLKTLCETYGVNPYWFILGKGKIFKPVLTREKMPNFGNRSEEVREVLRCMKEQPLFFIEVFNLFNGYLARNSEV